MTASIATAELTTELFPSRVPETTEAMTAEESASLAGWQSSLQGRAIYAALAAHIAERLGIEQGTLISVGEGEGLLARELAARLPGVRVVGTDLCPIAVDRARERHRAPNLAYEVASATDVARLGPADAVVCVFAFHHFHEPAAALEGMTRALVPGGKLYVQDLRRDADTLAYLRALDMYMEIAPVVARIFRASVRAAHTRPELRCFLTAYAPADDVEVGLVRFGQRALEGYRSVDAAGETLESSLGSIAGLWLEGLVVPFGT